MSAAAAGASGAHRDESVWHGLSAEDVSAQLGVDPKSGLDAGRGREAPRAVRAEQAREGAKEPGWHAFLRQYRDLMQFVLLGAAIVSIVALQEFGTGLAILGLTVLNAVLGLNQEGKAAESVAALQKMLLIKAHVRRGGSRVDIPSEELVPGDIVSLRGGRQDPGGRAAARGRDARDRGGGAHR